MAPTPKHVGHLVSSSRSPFQTQRITGNTLSPDMTSYSSSSFSGPSSPISPSVIARTDRKCPSGPRSPRSEARYQLSSNTRRENGSKVRCLDPPREPSLPDRMGSLAGPRKSPRPAGVSMTGLFPTQTVRESRSSKVRRKCADDSGSPSSTPPREARAMPSNLSQQPSLAFQAHHRHHEPTAAEYTNRRLLHGQLQVPTSPGLVSPALPLALSSRSSSLSSPPPRRPLRRAAVASSPLAYSLDERRVRFPATPSGSSTPKSSLRPRSVR